MLGNLLHPDKQGGEDGMVGDEKWGEGFQIPWKWVNSYKSMYIPPWQ